ncbi:threonine--tRNA ligase [Candidatus Peribacteria bacterium]|nr:threonine--tRNA ligase [Candidatus Peribacteria bacterium]
MRFPQSDTENRRRHTASHIMTYAVKMLRPDVHLGVGPWTDSGFYQDYDFGGSPLSEHDFKDIQKKMRWIINKNFAVVQQDVSEEHARAHFAGDPYKQELIDGILARGLALSFYHFQNDAGQNVYSDLCAGPHLSYTGDVGAFELTKIAGAYWRGDEKLAQLTRIYGVAFATEELLSEYHHFIAEAAKRDHRRLGQELGLFTFSDLVGPGLPLFTPKGTFIRRKIQDTIMALSSAEGYTEVCIPHLAQPDLYKTSGHWEKFSDDLFHVRGKNDAAFVMKPMNCPHHTQVYASQMRSYRDLPQRYMETTMVYRDEKHGELSGLSRVRSITQDDAHVFCRLSQVKDESQRIVRIIEQFYARIGMWEKENFWVSLSVRDPKTLEKYLGGEENWSTAERFLEEVCQEAALPYKRIEGEAAFYGPKLDFMFYDSLQRERQLSTIQIDFVQPERFGLEYTAEDGTKERPVMIHRAIAGSLERFMSVMIEHFAGAFPAWLSPVQCVVLPVNPAHDAAANALMERLRQRGVRAELWDTSETLGKRVRNAQTEKLPYSIVLGDTEAASGQLTVRAYGQETEQTISFDEFCEVLQ